MKQQNFGIEIEMTGVTREEAAKTIAKHFGATETYIGGAYNAYEVCDWQGRKWKVMSDASIDKECKYDKKQYRPITDKCYSVEVVSPILHYDELPTVQEIVRQVRHAGAKVNRSCGIHIHVDATNHTAKSLRNLLGIMYGKEDLLFKALRVSDDRVRYCKKTRESVLLAARKDKNLTLDSLKAIWYDKNDYRDNPGEHYAPSRYHALNLHATSSKKTVEFRLFNSTLHAGEVKAYVHLALAISAQAMRQKSTQLTKTASDNEKFTFRTWLLRLGLIGDEFANTREHLLKRLDGNAAWRFAPERYPTHPATIASNNMTAALA
ncbi:MAG: amidoligase family protein [Acidaminococcales bacterium]|jgi:hypothetical protein|nr:amidoligase family protein [Acidaminococcales bacterium]